MTTRILEAIPRDIDRKHWPKGNWRKLSARLTDIVADYSGRWDLIVDIAPDMGQGSPACMIHPRASIEIDGNHLPCDPKDVGDVETPEGMRSLGPIAGLLAHEAAHARNTRWTRKVSEKGMDGRVLDAALKLEESRIEAIQLRNRPQDLEWLRASATKLALESVLETDPRDRGKAWGSGAAALVLARADAGSLTKAEVAVIRKEVEGIFTESVTQALERIWREAHTVADWNHERMLDLGRRWVKLTKEDDTETSAIGMLGGYLGPPGRKDKDGQGGSKHDNDPIVVPGVLMPESLTPAQAKELRDAANQRAVELIGWGPGPDRRGAGVVGWRPPSGPEKGAARKLAKDLMAATYRERSTTTIQSDRPPGRLSMREIISADAADAAGAITEARPFRQQRHHVNPAPPLRIGVCQDVSSSMTNEAVAIGQAGWMIAYGAHLIPDAQCAVVTYGNMEVKPVILPGRTPEQVPVIECHGANECIGNAVEALDGLVGLSRPGAARLLVIVSDGRVTAEGQAPKADRLIRRLLEQGCHVLWVTNQERDWYIGKSGSGSEYPYPHTIPGVRWVSSCGADIIPIINREVVATIAEARSD